MSENINSKSRYELLIDARNFHYKNFHTWMAFFYIAIGAIFVGYCNLLTSQGEFAFEKIILLIFGYAVSLFWYWSCKGYYYWVTHWIKLLHEYEKDKDVKEMVYLLCPNKENNHSYCCILSGANISTSKVVLLFAFVTALAWGTLLAYQILGKLCFCKIYIQLSNCDKNTNFNICFGVISFIFSIAITNILKCIPKWCLQSKLDGMKEYPQEGTQNKN